MCGATPQARVPDFVKSRKQAEHWRAISLCFLSVDVISGHVKLPWLWHPITIIDVSFEL